QCAAAVVGRGKYQPPALEGGSDIQLSFFMAGFVAVVSRIRGVVHSDGAGAYFSTLRCPGPPQKQHPISPALHDAGLRPGLRGKTRGGGSDRAGQELGGLPGFYRLQPCCGHVVYAAPGLAVPAKEALGALQH
ncbi:unnamed protein product, partial [Effrenium voratum]